MYSISHQQTRYGMQTFDFFYVVWEDENGKPQRSLSSPTLAQAEDFKRWYEQNYPL